MIEKKANLIIPIEFFIGERASLYHNKRSINKRSIGGYR
jgi:hypothetical protein